MFSWSILYLVRWMPSWFISYFLWPLIFIGAYNPILLISSLALLLHPSLSWLLTVVSSYLLFIAAITASNTAVARRSLREALQDFLNADNGFSFEEADIGQFFDPKAYPHVFDTRTKLRKLKGDTEYARVAGAMPWVFSTNPLRVFIVTKKGGGIIGAAKAYVVPVGQSLIFLATTPDLLNACQRFILYHELEHVSLHGAPQIAYAYASRILSPVGVAFMCVMASSWFDWLGIVAYSVEWGLQWLSMGIMREVVADNAALHKISDPIEQKLVARVRTH